MGRPVPPINWGLRDYSVTGQLGREGTLEEYIEKLVIGFREARRVLRQDGILILNLGDAYAGSGKGPTGHNGIGDQERRQGFTGGDASALNVGRRVASGFKPKDLMLLPFKVAESVRADGWYLRSVLPWIKRNAMPESVIDRPGSAVEYIFLFSKSPAYYFDTHAVRKQGATSSGRNMRNSDLFFDTWQGLLTNDDDDLLALVVNPRASALQHFASFPEKLVEPFVRAGSSERGVCPSCLAPWRRVVERGGIRGSWTDHVRDAEEGRSRPSSVKTAAARAYENGAYFVSTLDWEPTCRCDAGESRPATILEPFLGSGTTALVAARLGRSCIGVELSGTYAERAERRIRFECPMFTDVEVSHG